MTTTMPTNTPATATTGRGLPADKHITYQQQYRKCGKRYCGTCRTSAGHGPYWYGYWREGGRLLSAYLGKERPAATVATVAATATVTSSATA